MSSSKDNLRIKRQYALVPHTADHVELRYGIWNPTVFSIKDDEEKGQLYRIMKCLDGTLSPAEITKKLDVSRATVESLIDYLMQLGVLESTASTAIDYYLETMMPNLRRSIEREESRVPVLVMGDSSALNTEVQNLISGTVDPSVVQTLDSSNPLFEFLRKSSEDWIHDPIAFEDQLSRFAHWKGSFIVLVMESIDPSLCIKLNAICKGLGISWIHGAIDGPVLFVGPTFAVQRGPCYECFETRISMNLRDTQSYQSYKTALLDGRVTDNKCNPIHNSIRSILCGHLSMEAINFVLTGNTFTIGKVLTTFIPTMEIGFHEVLRTSGCSSCGSFQIKNDTQPHFDVQALLGEVV